MPNSALGAPSPVGVSHCAQEVAVKAVIPATVRDVILNGFVRQIHQPQDLRLDRLRGAESVHGNRTTRAGLEIFDGSSLAEPSTETLGVGDELLGPTAL